MTTSEELQQAFGYLFPDEVQALKQLARGLPDKPIVVNIGAGAGTSGLAFMESRPDLRLITIDVRRDDSPLGCLVAEERVINEAFPETTLYSNNRYFPMQHESKTAGLLWRKSKEFASYELGWGFGYGMVDLVFIDADHTYNGCKGDILAWLPNIKPGGIMAIHDFGKKKRWQRGNLPDKIPHPLPFPGVDRAVRHYLCGKYDIVLYVDTLIAFRITGD